MGAKPRIAFSTFGSSADPMFVAYARFNRVIGSSARRTAGSAVAQVVLAGSEPVMPKTEPPRAGGPEMAKPQSRNGNGAALCGVWRILASNNRELGRSARAYKTFDAARSHVLALREEVDELVTTPVSGSLSGMHGFFMSLRTVPVITCGRWYGSAASSIEASIALREALRFGELDVVAKSIAPQRRQSRGRAPHEDLTW